MFPVIQDNPNVRFAETHGYADEFAMDDIEWEPEPSRWWRGSWGQRSFFDEKGCMQSVDFYSYPLDDDREIDIEDYSNEEGIRVHEKRRSERGWIYMATEMFGSDEEIFEHYGVIER